MFSSPQGKRDAERRPGPAGNHHQSASSGAKHRIEPVGCGSPRKTGCRTPHGGRPGMGDSSAGGLIFKIFTDRGVDTAAGDGKLDGLPRRGSGRIFDGVCPFLENSTVC